jgi:hypothetical protein
MQEYEFIPHFGRRIRSAFPTTLLADNPARRLDARQIRPALFLGFVFAKAAPPGVFCAEASGRAREMRAADAPTGAGVAATAYC